MEVRAVNVAEFEKAFTAMLANAKFNMGTPCNCLRGSYYGFASSRVEFLSNFELNISAKCYYDWFLPHGLSELSEPWPKTIDLTDALACIAQVRRIVEAHHGPQKWQYAERPKQNAPWNEWLADLNKQSREGIGA